MRFLIAMMLAAAAAHADPAQPLTNEQAEKIVPRANLSDLTDAQRGTFLAIATDVYNYAGCTETLARCLGKDQRDPHALRMAELVKQLVRDGAQAGAATEMLEKYYNSFDPKNRQQVRSDNCPVLGSGPIALVEFSDYQCPHCAVALQPLDQLVEKDRKGKVRLCSKFFPFASHPRARVAALCAEYARQHGKFWEMNGLLFANQESLEDGDLKGYAKDLGLDGDQMLKQVYSGQLDEIVEKHVREGTIAGVDSTPTLFIDGRVNQLPVKQFYLDFSLDDELAWQADSAWNPGAKAVAATPPATKKVAKRNR
ncbi:MAG TPA: DsbA family protein [Myxococcales bacterium]|nr:DsbA family protein [Myxococcales bacterium]